MSRQYAAYICGGGPLARQPCPSGGLDHEPFPAGMIDAMGYAGDLLDAGFNQPGPCPDCGNFGVWVGPPGLPRPAGWVRADEGCTP